VSWLLVFVPLLGAAIVHAPILRFDLFPRLRRPLDGGVTIRGRRLFGDHKTWRGALAMFTGIVACALVLSLWPWYWQRMPGGIRAAGPLPFAVQLGLGAVLGELPNSFLKRRLGIAPGTQRRTALGMLMAIVDQGDFVLGAWLLLAPLWTMTVTQAAIAFAVVVAVHLAVNLVGYAIGARTAPI
jgi:CDP-2,3-bis-(O-geranylgeranyl)-sn-glycerol synthase